MASRPTKSSQSTTSTTVPKENYLPSEQYQGKFNPVTSKAIGRNGYGLFLSDREGREGGYSDSITSKQDSYRTLNQANRNKGKSITS